MSKTAYICGPLTDLPAHLLNRAKKLYLRIADVYREVAGQRGFVPHEHCDPTVHSSLEPLEVDAIERNQVYYKTTVLVVVALAPSWGGGIEVEMANQANVPSIVCGEQGKKISRLLRGNPSVKEVIYYSDEEALLCRLRDTFREIVLEAMAAQHI